MKVYGYCYQEERKHHFDIKLKGSRFITITGDDSCIIGNEYSIYANLYDEEDNEGIKVFSCDKNDIEYIYRDSIKLNLKKHFEEVTFIY